MSFELADDLAVALANAEANLERLSRADLSADAARSSISAMIGAISSYSEIHYPLPYKRPDEPVIDLVTAANSAISALIDVLSTNQK